MEKPKCRNCGEPIEGLFCPNCGQQTDTGPLTWRSIVGSIVSGVIGNGTVGIKGHNARYGIFYTLGILISRPAAIIGEYIAGRRLKYYDPVALLLLISTAYILLGSLLGVDFLDFGDIGDDADAVFRSFYGFINSHPWAKALLQIPFVALGLKWFFSKRSDMRYIEYVYVAIFFSIAYLIVSTLRLPVKVYCASWVQDTVYYATIALMMAFYTESCHKLFGVSRIRSLLYMLCIQVLVIALIIITVLVVLLVLTILHDMIYSTDILLNNPPQAAVQAVDSLKP